MAEIYTISEVSKIVGLATHTIRYYEKEFPKLLNITRSKGGHRKYNISHLEAFKNILQLLKVEKLSIIQAKNILGEASETDIEQLQDNVLHVSNDTRQLLTDVLISIHNKLETISKSNQKQEIILNKLLQTSYANNKNMLFKDLRELKHTTDEVFELKNELSKLKALSS